MFTVLYLHEQPYGMGIFLLTAALLPSKQKREGLFQENASCISVSLRISSQVEGNTYPSATPLLLTAHRGQLGAGVAVS